MTTNKVSVGTLYASRKEVREAGLHAPTMAGIYPAGAGAGGSVLRCSHLDVFGRGSVINKPRTISRRFSLLWPIRPLTLLSCPRPLPLSCQPL